MEAVGMIETGSILKTQVLIIGGGIAGTGMARDLALRGMQCLVVEKGHINSGASGANHGLLHSSPLYKASPWPFFCIPNPMF
jgi:glycerol-3-phosphate dehydrogenase